MKLLDNAGNKVTKDKNGKNIEITELILVYYNIVNNDYQQYSKSFV